MKRYDRYENSDEFSYIEAKWTKKTDILMSHQIITVRKNREDTVKVFFIKIFEANFCCLSYLKKLKTTKIAFQLSELNTKIFPMRRCAIKLRKQ